MGFYRTFPSKNTYITNASVQGSPMTGSNFGASPTLNVFATEKGVGYDGYTSPNTVDLARSLLLFDITELSGNIYGTKTIPSSSFSCYLKLFNLVTDDTLPASYDLFVYPLSSTFDQGRGVDMDNGRDGGYANWVQNTSTTSWIMTGSDFFTASFGSGSQHFDQGDEDLEVNITDIVKNWLTASIPNYGLVVKLGNTEETNGNYFRKAFHNFNSKYVDRIPYLEVRYDDTLFDNRGNFALNQTNNLYMYNIVRGVLTNVQEPVIVRIQDTLGSASIKQCQTASFVSTGIYSASFSPTTLGMSASWCDIWCSGSNIYMTGTFVPLVLTGSQFDQYDDYVINVDNLKREYSTDEEARIIVNVRKKNWVTHVGPIHSASLDLTLDREYIDKMYYSITNANTNEVIVPFGTGSVEYTKLSYNSQGNYFSLGMNSFVPGFVYKIKFLIDVNKKKDVYDENFLFKVI